MVGFAAPLKRNWEWFNRISNTVRHPKRPIISAISTFTLGMAAITAGTVYDRATIAQDARKAVAAHQSAFEHSLFGIQQLPFKSYYSATYTKGYVPGVIGIAANRISMTSTGKSVLVPASEYIFRPPVDLKEKFDMRFQGIPQWFRRDFVHTIGKVTVDNGMRPRKAAHPVPKIISVQPSTDAAFARGVAAGLALRPGTTPPATESGPQRPSQDSILEELIPKP